nr:MAG TPA: DNA-directed RNA polymerase II subunit [Caudoviricetes sp.]
MDEYGKCHSCARFGTDECPTSSKCLAFEERPYFKPKIKKKNFVLRLICKHDYEYANQHKVNGGMEKRIHYVCKKCGKEKILTI